MVEDAGRAARISRPSPVNPQRVAWELSPKPAGPRHRHQRSPAPAPNWYARDLEVAGAA
ncbi:hypothetical protein ACU4GH_18615 [Bradyrhizobium betae]